MARKLWSITRWRSSKKSVQPRFTRSAPEKLSWELESATLMKSNSGSWVLEEISPEVTRATYTVDVAARVFVPKAVINMLVGSTLLPP